MASARYDIACVFWGESFSRFFLDYCVASLLAPNNAPALSETASLRLLIVTTEADWRTLEKAPHIREISQYAEIAPQFLSEHTNGDKYARMSEGHRICLALSEKDQARACVLCPDALLSDGALMEIHRSLEKGAVMVLAPAMRFDESGAIEQIERFREPAQESGTGPLVAAPRQLVGAVIDSLHHETLSHIWGTPAFSAFPVHWIYRLKHARGLLVHTYSWAPLAIDFKRLLNHDMTTLNEWTMDGDYVFKNCPNEDFLDVIEDSDRLFYVSLSAATERERVTAKNWMPRTAFRSSFFSAAMDPLKRSLFQRPILIHAEPLVVSELEAGNTTFEEVLSLTERPPRAIELLFFKYFGFGYSSVFSHLKDWITANILSLGKQP